MKKYLLIRCIALGLAALWAGESARAQELKLDWPKDGAVFQRNANGKGKIVIMGYFNSLAFERGQYQLTAALIPLDVRSGTVTGQTPITGTISYQPNAGQDGLFFSGFDAVNQGWYQLRLRAQPVAGSPNLPVRELTQKVGVGDVFIIAGQSNAQGLASQNPDEIALNVASFQGPLDGVRVRKEYKESEGGIAEQSIGKVTGFPIKDYAILEPLTSVSEAYADYRSGIGPTGKSLWLWARLGRRLVDTYGVPVAFYNCAWGGTTITEWARSTDTTKRVIGRNVDGVALNDYKQRGQPYSLLKKTMRLYAGLYGARAVLWQQGETDTQALTDPAFNDIGVTNWDGSIESSYSRRVQSSADYNTKLATIIEQSRTDFYDINIPWMVARASFIDNTTSSIIRNGQNITMDRVFTGPDMDNLISTNQRRSGAGEPTHLKGDGLVDAAEVWYNQIAASGLYDIAPAGLSSRGLDVVQPVVLSGDNRRAIAPAGSIYRWVAEVNGRADVDAAMSTQREIAISPESCGNCAVGSQGVCRGIVQTAEGSYIISHAIPMPYYLINDTQSTPQPTPGALAFQIVSYDCNTGVIQFQVTGGNGSPIQLTLHGLFSDQVTANTIYTATYPSDGRTGRTTAGQATQSGNQAAISFTNGCNLTGTPTPTPTPNPQPTPGALVFQIVSYDCNTGLLRFQLTGGNGSGIQLTLYGLFSEQVTANTIYTATYPSDGRTGRNTTGQATQSGNQVAISFTNGCNLGSGGRLAAPGVLTESARETVVYPNPAQTELTVSLRDVLPAEPVFVLTDVLGRVQPVAGRLTVVSARSLRLLVSQLAAGHYVLRITGGTAPGQTVRFVKQ
jgi:hypothetical protein